MTPVLTLWFSTREEQPVIAVWRGAGGATATARFADPHALAQDPRFAGWRARLILSAGQAVLRRLTLPPVSTRKQREALKFLLEDELAVTGEAYHYAAGAAGSDGLTPVAAVAGSVVEAARDWAQAAGLVVTSIELDCLAVAPALPERTVAIVMLQDRVLLLGDDRGGMSLTPDLAPLVLPAWCAANPDVNLVFDGTAEQLAILGLPADRTVRAAGSAEDDASYLAAALGDPEPWPVLNLAQGVYAPASDFSGRALWARAGAMAALLVLMLGGQLLVEAVQMRARADALRSDARALFQQTFPEVRRVVNLQSQMRVQLRGLSGRAGESFLAMSAILADSFAEIGGIRLEQLRYDRDDGVMIAIVDAAGFSDIEALRGLAAGRGLVIDERGARQVGTRVRSEIAVRLP